MMRTRWSHPRRIMLSGLIGVQKGPIEPWLPVFMFAIVFGLSMDYEVFLISRVHEEWTKTRQASRAVLDGLSFTGRVITFASIVCRSLSRACASI